MYSSEISEYIEQNRLKLDTSQMCKALELYFNKKITPKTLRKYYYRHNLDFKKMTTQRQNCTIKHEIGYESKPDKNGLIRVKINEKQWMYKQRYIYEKHYGKIPKGYKVIFLNNDKTDFRIENLAIIPNNLVNTLYCNKLTSINPEITKLGIEVAKLMRKVKEKDSK